VIARFRRGSVWVLVATELMGRGMDFPAVKQVINYDFPPSAVAYIHRIGRTGRGGRTGSAVTLFTEADLPALRSIANVMRLSGCDVPGWMLELRRMDRGDRKRLETRPTKRAPIFSARTKYDAKVARLEREERRGGGGKGKGKGSGGGGKGGKGRGPSE
jgi:ATP-dependent RNA helicase DDX52/ROK1